MITPGQQLAAARDTIRSLEEQLIGLYEEKEQAIAYESTIRSLTEMVESLDAQVCDLLEQRAEFERQVAEAILMPRQATLPRLAAAA
jgi:chorismate mutase